MAKNQVHLTFTQKELEFFNKKALLKKQTLWKLLQWEMNRVFTGCVVPEECVGTDKKINKIIDIPNSIWRPIVCLSKQIGITPGQLVYRVIIAPYLVEIATEGRLVVEVKSP